MAILTKPTNVDYARTLNFYAVESGKIIKAQELEREAAEKRKREEEERAALERQRLEKLAQAKALKEQERLALENEKKAKAEAMRAKIAESKKKKEAQLAASLAAAAALPKVVPPESSVGKKSKGPKSLKAPERTSKSKCHASREEMNAAYCTLLIFKSDREISSII